MFNHTGLKKYQNCNYKSKYYKYKNKYLNLKDQLAGSTQPLITYEEIDGTVHQLVPNENYKISGIIMCVGLVITRYDSENIFTPIEGIGIHVVNGQDQPLVHYANNDFTETGNNMKDEIEQIVNLWNNDDPISITFYLRPGIDIGYDTTSIDLRTKLLDWFTNIKDWSNLTPDTKNTIMVGSYYTGDVKFRLS
jgi:hypothetical protein